MDSTRIRSIRCIPHRRRPLTVLGTAVWIGIISCLTPRPAMAQSEVDPARLTRELQGLGMTDLIGRLGSDAAGDPATATAAAVAAVDTAFGSDAPDREATLERALATLRSAIAANPDADGVPIWRTDLARLLIDYRLRRVGVPADLFADFGYTTPAQEQVLAAAAPEALVNASLAADALFVLEGDLAANPALAARLRAAGLYDRLVDEYAVRRTPIYLAHASHLVTLLPDSAAYFKDRPLGGVQQPTAAAERTRLEREAARRLERVLQGNLNELDKHTFRSLLARIYGGLNDRQGASTAIQTVVDSMPHGEGDPTVAELNRLIALLAKSKLERNNGEFTAAAATAAQGAQQPLATRNMTLRLLALDAQSKALTAQAEASTGADKARLANEAFSVFDPLMNDPNMAAYILGRLSGGDVDDVVNLPVPARVAVGQQRTRLGLAQLREATAAEDQAGVTAARGLLEEAIRINQTLIAPENPADARAVGGYNLWMARWGMSRDDPATVLASAEGLVAIAREHPDQAIAEAAISNAVSMLRGLIEEPEPAPQVRQAYKQAGEVLFEKYPDTESARLEADYYGLRVLIEDQKRYKEAVDLYARTPASHPLYFLHRLRQLRAMMQWVEAAQPNEAPVRRTEMIEAARQVQREAQPAAGNRDIEAAIRGDAARALIEALFTLADVALQGDTSETPRDALEYLRQAVAVMDSTEIHQEEQLRMWAATLQVRAYVASRELDQAAGLVQRLMDTDPEKAQPLVQNLLLEFEDEINTKKAQIDRGGIVAATVEQYKSDISALANTANTLAEMLNEWGTKQGLTAEQLLPYQLALIRARRLKGQTQLALDLSRHLYDDSRFTNVRGVLIQHGETLFEMGGGATANASNPAPIDPEMLREAREIFSKIALQPGGYTSLGDDWWLAQLRVLQIREALGEKGEGLGLALARLKAQYPALGGPRYGRQFDLMLQRHPVSVVQPDRTHEVSILANADDDTPADAVPTNPAAEGSIPLWVWGGLGATVLVIAGLVLYLLNRKPKRPERRSTRATTTALGGDAGDAAKTPRRSTSRSGSRSKSNVRG